jgi:NADH dehydrogenase/NADH:ubiquinone oxidoreductase subunit G
MVYIKINGIFYNVPEGATILEVCLNRKIDVELPRFCYHELLS